MPLPAQLTANLLQVQMEQNVNRSDTKELVRVRRDQELQLDIEVLNGNRDAAGLRSEANNIRAAFNAAAAAVAAVGACCAAIPYVGPVIAAICAAVAAALTMIGQLWAQAKEDEAAAKEREVGKTQIQSDQVSNLVEDLKDDLKEREEQVDKLRDNLTDMIREDRQALRW